MSSRSDRLSYLCYRCHRCGRLLTKLEIIDKWEEAEKDISVPHLGLCVCGSRHISPSNPLWYEEFSPRVLKLWFYEIVLPWLKRKFGH